MDVCRRKIEVWGVSQDLVYLIYLPVYCTSYNDMHADKLQKNIFT